MARYMDSDRLIEQFDDTCKYAKPTNDYQRGCNEVFDWCVKIIKNSPTADVAPKSEVAREIIDEMLEGLQLVIDQEDKLGRNAWDEGDTAGCHIHQYAEERLETLKTALLLWKATKGGTE